MKEISINCLDCHCEEFKVIPLSCFSGEGKSRNDGRRAAFTLAEVLITLTIIGVIAALTISTLMKKYNDYVVVTRLKKAQSVLSTITTELFREYNPPRNVGKWTAGCLEGPCSNWTVKNPQEIANFIFSRMKVRYNCTFPNNTENKCVFSRSKYKNLDGTNPVIASGMYYPDQHYIVLTEDGMTYALKFNDWPIEGMSTSFGAANSNNDYKGYVWIWVDINGKQGPNTVGKDIFAFGITSNGLYPFGYGKSIESKNACNRNSNGATCAGKVLREGKISY